MDIMITAELRVIMVFLTSLIAVMFLIPKLARIATRIGLVDQPGERKVHDRPLPLVGGIAMVISATFSFLLFIPLVGLRGYFIGIAILLLIGFLDDYSEIGHREKFLAQILATSILMYASKISLVNFGNLFGFGEITVPDYPLLVWIVTVFCVVGVINAVNLIDGLDGLAGGFSFIAFLTFAVHASLHGNTTVVLLNLALLGAVLGFLRFNWIEAQVFMGDAGSLCLGFSLAFMALILTQKGEAHSSPVVPLLILAVPIVDTLTVMMKRILRGQSPFKPDKYHLHHIFIRYGIPKAWAVRVILGICLIFSGLSVLGALNGWPEWVYFLIFIVYFAVYIITSFYIIILMRFGQKFIRQRQFRGFFSGSFSNPLPFLKYFENLKVYKYLRKSSRHIVALRIDVIDTKQEHTFPGTVINISSGGLMADIPGLKELVQDAFLRITYRMENEDHFMEIPARHVWVSNKEKRCYHGFEFLQFDGDQDNIIFRLLVKSKKSQHLP